MKYLVGWLLAGAVIAAAVLWWRDERGHAETVERLEAERDSLRDVAQRVDTVYATDTIQLTRVRTTHDTTWLATTDTVIHRDTVIRIVEAERAACDAVVRSCEQRIAIRNRMIVNLDSLLTLERKRNGGRFGCAGPLSANTKGAGLGAACGLLVRF